MPYPRRDRRKCGDGKPSPYSGMVIAGGAYVPTVVVGMYAPFGAVGAYHATICMPRASIVALWHVEDPAMGAYIATTGVATYAPPPALLALAQEAQAGREDRLRWAEAQFRRASAQRGLDWDRLSEDERESFADALLHEK